MVAGGHLQNSCLNTQFRHVFVKLIHEGGANTVLAKIGQNIQRENMGACGTFDIPQDKTKDPRQSFGHLSDNLGMIQQKNKFLSGESNAIRKTDPVYLIQRFQIRRTNLSNPW